MQAHMSMPVKHVGRCHAAARTLHGGCPRTIVGRRWGIWRNGVARERLPGPGRGRQRVLRRCQRGAPALRRGGKRPLGGAAARLPGVLVFVASSDSGARAGRLPRRRTGHAGLQPVEQAERLARIRRRVARGRHRRPDPSFRRRGRLRGGPRLGCGGCVLHRDGAPRRGQAPGDPQRAPPRAHARFVSDHQTAAQELVHVLLPASADPGAAVGGTRLRACQARASRGITGRVQRRGSSSAMSRRGLSRAR